MYYCIHGVCAHARTHTLYREIPKGLTVAWNRGERERTCISCQTSNKSYCLVTCKVINSSIYIQCSATSRGSVTDHLYTLIELSSNMS